MSKTVAASVNRQQLNGSYEAIRNVRQKAEKRMERVNQILGESRKQQPGADNKKRG